MLLSVPHAGRDYPEWLIALCKGGAQALDALEDPLVDDWSRRAIDKGIGAVVAARRARQSTAIAARTRSIPTVVRTGPIAGAQRAGARRPRHRPGTHRDARLAVAPADRARRARGAADAGPPALSPGDRGRARRLSGRVRLRACCSTAIPCRRPTAGRRSIIGDRHGQSAGPWVTSEAVKIVTSMGFRAGVNQPFAGGHVVQRHGAPARGIHALQIEIDRRCYLQHNLVRRGPGFDKVARLFEQLAMRLGQFLLERRFSRSGRIEKGPSRSCSGTAQFREERTIWCAARAAMEGSHAAANCPQDGNAPADSMRPARASAHASAVAGCGHRDRAFALLDLARENSRICDSENRCA